MSETQKQKEKWGSGGYGSRRKKWMKNSREGLRKERNDLYSIDLKSSLAVFLNDAALNLSEKWKRPPNQPLRQREKLATSGLLTPEMYQPLSVLPPHNTFSFQRECIDVATMKQSRDDLCRGSDGNSSRPRQVDPKTRRREKSERDRWPGRSW